MKTFWNPTNTGIDTKNLQSLFQGLGRDTAIELENLLTDDRLSNFRDFF